MKKRHSTGEQLELGVAPRSAAGRTNPKPPEAELTYEQLKLLTAQAMERLGGGGQRRA